MDFIFFNVSNHVDAYIDAYICTHSITYTAGRERYSWHCSSDTRTDDTLWYKSIDIRVIYSFAFHSCDLIWFDAMRCDDCSDMIWNYRVCFDLLIWSDLIWSDLMGSECALGTCSSADYVVGWVDYIKEDIICCIYQYISCFRLISHYYYEHYSVNVILIRF